ncbi:hypothetical protein P152DRAFT_387977 [Eremomyces bilateralis CBS 781.70]|uniref:LYC1 C-terminal domain-containing protein n=1 Tax=Eremomyces bilateralis CBS 781.70 TaxID=1392243 RepID=A0A6G1GHD1_9PEZI|nr:uncharacterized protein P152DRAFT_387977 [Eremomyces bilateralis CBS 781.70]KAF1817279.1 hypothetical protein P152DRAFT_387977 [Eremomyces bilateralis CBS 781.70]
MATVPSKFPDAKSPSVHLAHPTPSERRAFLTNNGQSWRGNLTIEQYLVREDAVYDYLTPANMTYWVLVDGDGEERMVLSSCETYKRRGIVAREGKVKDVVGHGIGSVFCRPELRGRGYAGRMMEELGKKLQHWQTEEHECLFSVLFSDIGKKYYAQFGWQPFPSTHLHLATIPLTTPSLPSLPPTRPLTTSSLPPLCTLDESLLRHRLPPTSAASPSTSLVTFLTTAELLGWHHVREDVIATATFGRPAEVRGAVCGEEGERVWCYWLRSWYNADGTNTERNHLHVLRIVVEGWDGADGGAVGEGREWVGGIAAVLDAARREASGWQMEGVEVWNPSEVVVEAGRLLEGGCRVEERETESIPCLRWYGERKGESVRDDVQWVANEKAAWC